MDYILLYTITWYENRKKFISPPPCKNTDNATIIVVGQLPSIAVLGV